MIIYSILITGSTYAYLYLENNNSIISGTGKCEGINYKGENISNSNLVSTTNYLEGAKSTIHLSSSNDCQIYTLVSIYLHTNDSTTSPITTVFALKYKVFQGDNQISEGVIDRLGDQKIATVSLTSVDTSYDVYLYIDSSISKGSFNNTLYSGYLYASSYQSSSVDRFLVRDLSYYTNDAISYGALLDKGNGIVTTDGVDDYIDAGYANYDFKDSVTLISRFKWLKDNGTENDIIDNYEGAGVGISITSDGSIFFQICSEAGYQKVQYTANLSYNEWYTVVGTYDGNIMKLYLNGKLVSTSTVTGTIKSSPCPIYLGANPGVIWATGDFSNFTYSDALLYDRALSEEEIMEVFSGEINKNKVSWDKLLFYYDFK